LTGLALPLVLGLSTTAARGQGLESAEEAFRTGRYDDAIRMFELLARRDRSSDAAARGECRTLLEVGRHAEAEEAARRYNRDNPGSAELQNMLGAVLHLSGDLDGAAAAFEAAIQGGAGDALNARLNLAILRYERGEHEAALEDFEGFVDVYNREGRLTSEELTTIATALRYLGLEDWRRNRDALRVYDEAIAADPSNPEPRIKVGELFLEKYNGGDAAESFRDVLEANPNHPRAWVGTARQRRFAGSPGALEAADRSLEINPNLVAARVFRAELLLEAEEYEGARREAERALRVNPSSLEAQAVLAATRYLQGDREGFESLRRRVLEMSPTYAGLYVRLVEASARNRLYAEAVDFARQAVALDPQAWRGYSVLGVNQLRIGAMEEGRRNLERAFEGDPDDIWTKNTLDLLDTFDHYQEVGVGRFLWVIDRDESELLSLYMGDLAEEAFDRLADSYGYQPQTPVRIEVYRSHADFSVRTVGLVGLGALGVSFGPVVAMDSPAAREAGEFNWGSTLWHELAHTFHLGLSQHRVPRWFSEGLAVHEERRARPGWGDDVTPSFLLAFQQGRLHAIRDLNNGFTRPDYPEQIIHSYYQASLVFDLIERDFASDAIVAMLRGYRDGLSNEEAFQQVLGVDIDAFGDRFDSYLKERFRGPLAALRSDRYREGGPERGEIARWADEDTGDFLAQLGYGHLLAEEGDYEKAVTYLERAKQLFPEFAGAGSPYWYLAQIYEGRGELAAAEAELTALTAINERDYLANLELADVRQRLGDAVGAAEALARVAYIYPYDMDLHVRLAELYTGSGRFAAAVRERKAILALGPVDRAEALYQLALAQYRAADLRNARRTVLRALEAAPAYEDAQALLLRIHEEGGGTR
jgi:tetratricopeptide (TPR) repeat protein